MEKPIFGWAASAITGSDSSARAVANSVRFTFFIWGVLLLLLERHGLTMSIGLVKL